MSGVVHFEIPADNEDRARKFYESVFGWTFQVLPEMEYSLAMTTPVNHRGMPTGSGAINGGIFRRGDMLVAPVVTIDVDDIDAALEQIQSLGGATVRGRMEVPGSGWNAYFRDSEGNVVGLWQNAQPRPRTEEPTLVHCTEQPTAVVRETVAMAALTEFFSRAFGSVMAEAQRQNVQLAGPPFALYRGCLRKLSTSKRAFRSRAECRNPEQWSPALFLKRMRLRPYTLAPTRHWARLTRRSRTA
jgi:predicted enzyme related to lactoylglutathione lyase